MRRSSGEPPLPQFKFAPVHIGFIFPRSSEHAELRRQFNSVLDQLSQSGLLDKEFTTLGDKVGLCDQTVT